jgi:nucleotide-binding universal stress UspA family protein
MVNIIVPTDFSATAKCALFFASKMAEVWGEATLKVVHVFMPAVESEYPNFVPPVAEYLRARERMLEEFLKEAGLGEEKNGQLTVEREVLVGFPADEIARASEEQDLIVMGTTGDGDILNKIFGSVSSAVARRAECPVVLIPRDMEFSGFDHILYASNYESVSPDLMNKLIAFNKPFQACIHFVHVRDKKDFQRSKETIFQELFAEGDPPFSFELAEVEGESVDKALNQYAKEHDIDLVVMVSQQRTFWENFFRKSETKKMALTTRIPLMVLHE